MAKVNLEALKLINEVTLPLLEGKDLLEICTKILTILRSHIGAFGGILYLVDKKTDSLYTYCYSKIPVIETVLMPIRSKVFGYRFPLQSNDLLISRCVRENKDVTAESLADFFSPVLPKKHLGLIQKFLGVKHCMAFPIYDAGEPKGAIFIAFRKDTLADDEKKLIEQYVNFCRMVLRNHLRVNTFKTAFEAEKETIALIGHELKNPITMAYNETQNLAQFIDKKPEKVLNTSLHDIQLDIQSSIERLNNMLKSIMHLRDVEKGACITKQPINMQLLLEQLIKNYKKRAEEKGLYVQDKLHVEPGTYDSFGVQFEQVLSILLDNAIKYTDKGGINLKINVDKDGIFCQVSDTGPGIPHKKKRRIFDKFYRVHRGLAAKQKGMGLGLYVAQKVVTGLGGEITIADSKTSTTGTQFTVTIPQA